MAVVHPTQEAYSNEFDQLFATRTYTPTLVPSTTADVSLDLEKLFKTMPARRDTEPLEELDEISDIFLDEDEEEGNGDDIEARLVELARHRDMQRPPSYLSRSTREKAIPAHGALLGISPTIAVLPPPPPPPKP